MMRARRATALTLQGGLLVALMALAALAPLPAGALGTTYFDNADVSGNATIQVAIGQTQYVQHSSAQLKAYFTSDSGQIQFQNYTYCPSGDDEGPASSKKTTFSVVVGKGQVRIGDSGAWAAVSKSATSGYVTAASGRCGATLTFSVRSLPMDPAGSGYYMAQISVSNASTGYFNYFKVKTPTRGGIITHAKGSRGWDVTVDQITPNSGHTDYQVKFGSDCSVKSNVRKFIRVFDLDGPGGSGAQVGPITLKLKEKPISGGSWSYIKLANEGSGGRDPGGGSTSIQPLYKNNYDQKIWFTAKPNRMYVFELNNIYYNNTIQFGVPFDGIFHDVPCAAWDASVKTVMKVNGTVKNGTSDSPTRVKAGDVIDWAHTITNTGPGKTDDIDWTIKRAYSPALDDLTGSWAKGKAAGASVTYDYGNRPNTRREVSSKDVGKKLCQRIVIKPYGKKANGALKGQTGTTARCVLVTSGSDGGGSVDNGVDVSPSTYSYYPKLAAVATINSTGYPKEDTFQGVDYPRNTYGWRMFEIKFRTRPSGGVGTSEQPGCAAIEGKYSSIMLSDSCVPLTQGTNLFPNGNPQTKRAESSQTGVDPIGTWTCYTFRYRTNPPPSAELEAAIEKYVKDNRKWIPAVKNAKGEVVTPGHWDIKKSDFWPAYQNADPKPTPAKYNFTPFDSQSCSVAGIDPKVQIRSGDLKVNGSISTSLRTMEVGNAVGSYGSSGEYGVLSSGPNVGMASGSGLLRGSSSNQGDWSTLTFTNNVTGNFGNFDGILAESDHGIAPSDGVPYDNKTSFGSGDKIIYRVSGTLSINSNLAYEDTYRRISQIPRVVIIADNIQIAPNVTRIDPWLIAENISTCGAPRGSASWGDSASEALAEANLKTGECNWPLVFNGPVYASNIYLYRTGGSRALRVKAAWDTAATNPDHGVDPHQYCENASCGSGDSGRRYSLSAPAEVFNLRSDVYLSSFAGSGSGGGGSIPVAVTDSIRELSPRF